MQRHYRRCRVIQVDASLAGAAARRSVALLRKASENPFHAGAGMHQPFLDQPLLPLYGLRQEHIR